MLKARGSCACRYVAAPARRVKYFASVAARPAAFPRAGLRSTSCVQELWFSEQTDGVRLSKAELAKRIEALVDLDEPTASTVKEEISSRIDSRISMLVGEIKHTDVHHDGQQCVHSVMLSRICSPRTILSGRTSTKLLAGRKVVVLTNFPWKDTAGVLSQGMLVSDAQGELLTPSNGLNVGDKLTLADEGSIIDSLAFDEQGFAVLRRGELIKADD
ncbi:hypothetical protein PYCC9005_005556 [Savitreella phatthalungensis]